MIEIKGVSKWYGTFQVLTDCTMAVARGEVVVVCGPAHSGAPNEKTSISVEMPHGDSSEKTNL